MTKVGGTVTSTKFPRVWKRCTGRFPFMWENCVRSDIIKLLLTFCRFVLFSGLVLPHCPRKGPTIHCEWFPLPAQWDPAACAACACACACADCACAACATTPQAPSSPPSLPLSTWSLTEAKRNRWTTRPVTKCDFKSVKRTAILQSNYNPDFFT